jgi:hypothetical protein
MVDPANGSQITMPVETAKERLLQQPIKVKAGTEADAGEKSRLFVSGSSGGRLATEKRR